MRKFDFALALFGSFLTLAHANGQEATIEIHADQVIRPISRFLTGSCIEDVNHEIYGGIDSQMIYGEAFQEPAPLPALKGFTRYSGQWIVDHGELRVSGGDGPKLLFNQLGFADGTASVEILFSEKRGGNAGMLAKVTDAGDGADAFNGYEIALDTGGYLILGRHRHNWEPIQKVPCEVPIKQWITLGVRMANNSLDVSIDGKRILAYTDTDALLRAGQVGLRVWQREAHFRNLSIETAGTRRLVPFEPEAQPGWDDGVSGAWKAFHTGSARGGFALDTNTVFNGRQSQWIRFEGGDGEIGIENQGLNRWGMPLAKGKRYEGFVCVRAPEAAKLAVALESGDGSKRYAKKRLTLHSDTWQRVKFSLTPSASDRTARFSIMLEQPGSVEIGYAFLEPGNWGRFKGLPDRKDVVDGLLTQGVTVLRYGGSMVNAPEYRWKKMIGPRDCRPPYHGFWHPDSSDGWGIIDFLNLCESAGFLAIPDFNIDETPQDMADFIEYVNGSRDSEWGRKRVADGHAAPYHLTHLELGNEERVDETYWRKFKALAEAIWAKDTKVIPVVGDFAYNREINDPFDFNGSDARITTLSAHQQILELAKQHGCEVWFDVHLNTEGPTMSSSMSALPSFVSAIDKLAVGAKHRVVVFELNANNHQQRRALSNAQAIMVAERLGLPIVTSANGLQPDGQNDNGWNQGLLFLNPSHVWLQPPGYVTQMVSCSYEPLLVSSDVRNVPGGVDAAALRSQDGKTLIVQIVNFNADHRQA